LDNSPKPSNPDEVSIENLTRIFSTALVSSRTPEVRDFSAELFHLVETPAFHAILGAVRQLAKTQGVSERDAARTIIETFRNLDKLWGDYLFQEGVEQLRGKSGSN
jgi:LPS sulfotransferase NodH